jgi:hypothetical protein
MIAGSHRSAQAPYLIARELKLLPVLSLQIPAGPARPRTYLQSRIMQALEASDLGCSCPPFCVSIHQSGQRYKILEEVPCSRCIEPIITARCATYMVARYAACGNDDPLASEIQEIGTA